MRFPVAKAFLLAVLPMMAGAAADSLGFNPEKNPEKALGMYIAPENSLIYRMRQPDGSTREFERIYARPGTLASVRGWKGRFAKDAVAVESGPDVGFAAGFLRLRGATSCSSRGAVADTEGACADSAGHEKCD